MLPIRYQKFSESKKVTLKNVKLTKVYNYGANINIYLRPQRSGKKDKSRSGGVENHGR
jgi:hypothetical protein